MKIIVTGVNGFVGKHLSRELKDRGDGIIGVGRENAPAAEIKELLTAYIVCDLTNKKAIAKLPLGDAEAIISLAGLARVGDSFAEPEKYKAVNVAVLENILEALHKKALNPRVIAVSTGTIYSPKAPLPLVEDSELIKDGSPYALSKILMEEAAQKFRSRKLDIIIARPFNHIGPGQEDGFLIPDLFAKLTDAKFSGKSIKVGNLSTRRDYTDVRDVVRAYADLAHAEELRSNVYNICCGMSISGQEILDRLIALMGVSPKIEKDPDLMRPNDNPDLYGSYKRLRLQTGWSPKINIDKTLKDFLASRPKAS